jgi:hypothetical protein
MKIPRAGEKACSVLLLILLFLAGQKEDQEHDHEQQQGMIAGRVRETPPIKTLFFPARP